MTNYRHPRCKLQYLIIGAGAFILSVAFMPVFMKIAHRFAILDRPTTHLKKHERPIPYLGGVAIYLAFLITVGTAKILMHQTFHGIIGIILGATIIVLMGIIDDVKNLPPYPKLIIQLITAAIIIGVNIHINFMENNIVNIILTVIWVVGITNAMNIIDIMDGLAGGVAAIAALAFFVVATLAGRVNDMIPAIALFGAVGGYLIYNKPPAKIYMGDAGSLFLGFMLATLALNESYSKINFIAVLSPILILGVPIFDTTLVTFIRIRKGIMPLYGSNDHLAQRIVMLGFTKTQAVLILLFISLLLSLLAVWSTFLNFSGALLLYLGSGFTAVFAGMAVAGVDMSDYHNILKKRQKAEISSIISPSKK